VKEEWSFRERRKQSEVSRVRGGVKILSP